MKAKYGGKLPSAVQVVKDKIRKESGKGAIKETAADKIISSIRSERVDEGKLVHGPFGPYITDQKMPKEQKETPLKNVPYEGLNGNRKSVGEAKYDNTKSPDYKKKKKALAKKHGGEENIKGHPQYEEVGVSSSAAMTKAIQDAKLKSKEEAAVKKMKKEEVAPAVDKVIESIKINKASPKSPNCIIMPKKDDIADKAGGNGKKSTKNVVSKKQKQFFNQEGKTYTLKEFQEIAKSAIVKTGGALGKKVKPGDIAKVAPKVKRCAIVKAAPKTTAITQVDPKAIAKTKPKVTTLAKSGAKQTAIQTATQTAVDKVGDKKPPTTAEKGGALTKQGNQSKGFNLPSLKNRQIKYHTLTNIKNPQ